MANEAAMLNRHHLHSVAVSTTENGEMVEVPSVNSVGEKGQRPSLIMCSVAEFM